MLVVLTFSTVVALHTSSAVAMASGAAPVAAFVPGGGSPAIGGTLFSSAGFPLIAFGTVVVLVLGVLASWLFVGRNRGNAKAKGRDNGQHKSQGKGKNTRGPAVTPAAKHDKSSDASDEGGNESATEEDSSEEDAPASAVAPMVYGKAGALAAAEAEAAQELAAALDNVMASDEADPSFMAVQTQFPQMARKASNISIMRRDDGVCDDDQDIEASDSDDEAGVIPAVRGKQHQGDVHPSSSSDNDDTPSDNDDDDDDAAAAAAAEAATSMGNIDNTTAHAVPPRAPHSTSPPKPTTAASIAAATAPVQSLHSASPVRGSTGVALAPPTAPAPRFVSHGSQNEIVQRIPSASELRLSQRRLVNDPRPAFTVQAPEELLWARALGPHGVNFAARMRYHGIEFDPTDFLRVHAPREDVPEKRNYSRSGGRLSRPAAPGQQPHSGRVENGTRGGTRDSRRRSKGPSTIPSGARRMRRPHSGSARTTKHRSLEDVMAGFRRPRRASTGSQRPYVPPHLANRG